MIDFLYHIDKYVQCIFYFIFKENWTPIEIYDRIFCNKPHNKIKCFLPLYRQAFSDEERTEELRFNRRNWATSSALDTLHFINQLT